MKAQEHDQGIRVGSWWYSSLRVQGGGWVTMNSNDVGISIAGGVRKIIRGELLGHHFFFFYSVSDLFIKLRN